MKATPFSEHARASARQSLAELARAQDADLRALSARVACAFAYAGMVEEARRAWLLPARELEGGDGLLRTAWRLRFLLDSDPSGVSRVGDQTPFLNASANAVAIQVPRAILYEAGQRGKGLHAASFAAADAASTFEALLDATVALALDRRLLGFAASPARRREAKGPGFVLLFSGPGDPADSGDEAEAALSRLGMPIQLCALMAPGEAEPRAAEGFRFDGTSLESSAKASEAAGAAKIAFPIGLKLVLVVSCLLLSALLAMNGLASAYFLRDATVRVEENNHTVSQIMALKVEADLRAALDLAGLAIELSGGVPGSEALGRLFQANPELLAVVVPGLASLPNRGAIASSGARAQSIETVAAQVSGGASAGVFNATRAMGLPALALAAPFRYSGGESTLVAIVAAADYLEAFDARGIIRSWAVNAEGRLILHADGDLLAAATDFSSSPIVQALRASPVDNGQLRFRDEDGVEYLGSFRRSDFAGIGVVAVAPTDRAFEAVDAIGRRNYYILGAVLSVALVAAWFFSRSLTGPVAVLMGAARKVERGEFELDLVPSTRDELGSLIDTFSSMCRGLAERERIKTAFGRFVNKAVAELAMKGEISLGGERRSATILFSDIRSFTAISETMEPEQVVEFLNRYFSRMVACVNGSGGAVDKFIGDAIMAIWGVPVSTGADPVQAVEAALAMRASLREFNVGRGGPGLPLIRNGCGINSGPVLAGQIGSAERMEYTVIGDTVNLASRVEALNKPFGTDILVTESTLLALGDAFAVEPMPRVRVKGKAEALRVYAILGRKGDASRARSVRELRQQLGNDVADMDAEGELDGVEELKYEVLEPAADGERP